LCACSTACPTCPCAAAACWPKFPGIALILSSLLRLQLPCSRVVIFARSLPVFRGHALPDFFNALVRREARVLQCASDQGVLVEVRSNFEHEHYESSDAGLPGEIIRARALNSQSHHLHQRFVRETVDERRAAYKTHDHISVLSAQVSSDALGKLRVGLRLENLH